MSEDNIIPITPKKLDVDVQEYFRSLGYHVDWDCRKAVSEEWYEIIDSNNELVAQIDTGVPLDHIVEDLTQLHKGLPPTSPSNYKINGSGPKFNKLVKEVHDKGPKKKD